ncbi:2143_t:CDS:2, partial [Funneliformis geosporum]
MDSSGDQLHKKLPSSLANSSPRPLTAVKTNASYKQQSRFVDLDWEFLNGNAHIVFHFNNRKLLLEAINKALEQYPQEAPATPSPKIL